MGAAASGRLFSFDYQAAADATAGSLSRWACRIGAVDAAAELQSASHDGSISAAPRFISRPTTRIAILAPAVALRFIASMSR